jgi:hypothetical protein
MLANFSEETLTVPKHTVLGITQQVSEELINEINPESESDTDRPLKRKKNEVLYKKLLPGKLNHLSPEDRRHIEHIMKKYAHLFHDEEENDFKCTNVTEHQIQVGDVGPIRNTPYTVPYALRQEMQDQVKKMLHKNVISPSNSPSSAPTILVQKKKGPEVKPQ